MAWVSERKDVLSALWWFLAIGAYVRYARRPSLARYLSVGAALALGLLSKAMGVTLPVVLLLLDVWPLGRLRPRTAGPPAAAAPGSVRFRRLLLEKLPLAALCAAVGVAAFLAQRAGRAVVALEQLPLGERLANALLSAVTYLGQTVWPLGLGAYYPLPPAPPAAAKVGVAFLLLAGTTGALLLRWRRAPFLAVGWLWYLVALLPVSGIVQVGGQAHADRYTYLPLVGPAIGFAWGVEALTRRVPRRALLLAPAAGLALGALALLCRFQVGTWRDDLALYGRALAVTRDNWMMRNNMGKALAARGERERAIAEYREALRIKPSFVLARYNLAGALAQAGREAEAGAEYRAALGYNPLDADLHIGLAGVLERQGDGAGALRHYRLALTLRPPGADLHQRVGILLVGQGRLQEAAESFRAGRAAAPGSAAAHMNLGNVLVRLGEAGEARVCFLEALRLDPGAAEAHFNFANLLAGEGKLPEAIGHYREALRSKPVYAEAHLNLAVALYRAGTPLEALREGEEALRLAPDSAEAHANLGAILIGLGRAGEAEPHLRQALVLRPDFETARRALAGSGRAGPRGPAPEAR